MPNSSAAPSSRPAVREVVATFADRAAFESAIQALIQAGFSRSDLSVLSSHDSIDVAGQPGKPWKDVLVALVGEMKYEGPLVAAGLIALAAGPVGVAVASLVAAGVGGVAAKELLDEISAIPESDGFARALAAGSVIVWVMVRDAQAEESARRTLAETGGANIHVFERPQKNQ